MMRHIIFFFNDTATTEIYTLSLHDALPISRPPGTQYRCHPGVRIAADSGATARTRGAIRTGGRSATPSAHKRTPMVLGHASPDRKSTRLNSSHQIISYAVFCLKKKNKGRQR